MLRRSLFVLLGVLALVLVVVVGAVALALWRPILTTLWTAVPDRQFQPRLAPAAVLWMSLKVPLARRW